MNRTTRRVALLCTGFAVMVLAVALSAQTPQQAPKPRSIDDMEEGIRRHVRERHARD